MLFIKNGTINTITNGIINGDILIEDGKIIEKARNKWDMVSRNVTHNIGRLRLKRYLATMANVKLRKRYFGF